jgi:folate-binding protein YgfZ
MSGADGQEGFDGYDEVRTAAAVEVRPPGGLLAIGGKDAVSFLQGVLTNDVASLEPGRSCYAASLTAQGRMVSDMHVLRRDRDVLLVVEPGVAAELAARFDQSIFTEDVSVADLSAGIASIGIHGPAAHAAAASAADPHAAEVRSALHEDRHATLPVDGGALVVFGGTWLGVPAVRVIGPPDAVRAVRQRLAAAGLPELGPHALAARRIEAGTPVFGIDMTPETIPLEAGIEPRAISLTKGCYVGQEIIVRILHRGGGRVARRLVGLTADSSSALAPGTRVHADGREVGTVTSAAWSPALGSHVALAMVHRDAFEPGTTVVIGGLPGSVAAVRQLPLLPHAAFKMGQG